MPDCAVPLREAKSLPCASRGWSSQSGWPRRQGGSRAPQSKADRARQKLGPGPDLELLSKTVHQLLWGLVLAGLAQTAEVWKRREKAIPRQAELQQFVLFSRHAHPCQSHSGHLPHAVSHSAPERPMRLPDMRYLSDSGSLPA